MHTGTHEICVDIIDMIVCVMYYGYQYYGVLLSQNMAVHLARVLVSEVSIKKMRGHHGKSIPEWVRLALLSRPKANKIDGLQSLQKCMPIPSYNNPIIIL